MIIGTRNFLAAAVMAAMANLASAAVAGGPLLTDLGGESGFGQRIMAPNDDGSSVVQALPFSLNFFGNSYDSYFVNNNGNISFGRPLSEFTPQIFPIANVPMIAPYWGDVDTRNQSGLASPFQNNVYLHATTDSVVVTWDTVGYYNEHNDKQNTFQLVLTDRSRQTSRAGDFDMEFRYGRLEWTTGDASGGNVGLGGYAAVAGWNAGAALNSFALAGSGSQNVLQLVNGGNTGQTGVYRFEVRSDALAGSTPYNPILPTNPSAGDGAWEFVNVPVSATNPVWFDPEVAVGYEYKVNGNGPLISSVILPQGIGDGRYDIYVWEGGDWKLLQANVLGGETFTFDTAVDRFKVLGIEETAGLNPASPIAFSAGLVFTQDGTVNLSQHAVSVTVVPEPSTYAMLGAGLAMLGMLARRRKKAGSAA
nr:nidogen-like domain-containing protein [uncultured Duganella sp.]